MLIGGEQCLKAKAENRGKGLAMGSACGDAMQCESMRLLWGCDY